jgi:hypothetical protein
LSDNIQALNTVVGLAGQRERNPAVEKDPNDEQLSEWRGDLLEQIAVVAGDALEEHDVSTEGNRPRRERVFRAIVEEIAVFFCDECDTAEGAFFVEEGVRDILREYGFTTTDSEGREVLI